uniref:Bax inhibitor 1 n=1 Tax=Canis lupus familiaris TaxID=9615 RepID=A0A8C0RP93_CANLF
MNIFDRKINFDALLKFSHITPSTQQHLKKVYASFALCMFVAAAGAYVHVVTHFLQAGLLSALGSLGLMIWLMATPHSHETEQKRLGLLAGFAFLTGVGLGPALELCIAINPSILPTAFMGTAMIFTCFTLSALYARRRSYLFLGGVLMSAMSLMLLSSLGNLFFGSIWLFQLRLCSLGGTAGPEARAPLVEEGRTNVFTGSHLPWVKVLPHRHQVLCTSGLGIYGHEQ